MTNNEIITKASQIRELERLIEEAQAESEALKNEIKELMGEAEELRAGEYKITWKTVTSSRLDTKGLKEAVSEEILKLYTKTTTTRRFSIT